MNMLEYSLGTWHEGGMTVTQSITSEVVVDTPCSYDLLFNDLL